MIKIWGRNTSSNVQKVMWAVGEMGLPHERIDIGGPFGKNREAEYLAMNPNGLVPTLEEEDGFLLWESNSVVRYLAAKHKSTVLEPAEIVTWVDVPAPAAASRSLFLKHAVRNTWDFALSEVAVSVTPGAGRWDQVRIALGGVAPFPYRATAAEAVLAGQAPTESRVREAAEAALHGARPLALNGYKIDLTKALVARALAAVMS